MPDIEVSLQRIREKGRPNTDEYIRMIFSDFYEMRGDRLCGDDPSIIGGIARLESMPVTVIGQRKGRNLKENLGCNFSMCRPEGYRKAIRLMKQAEKFSRPVLCFIDTLGAYPGREAEEHGQGAAISECLCTQIGLSVPIVSILAGDGGSGGALALCAADRVAALEYAVLGVISPRACATILWKDPSREIEAASLLRMTSDHLYTMGVVDEVLPEPCGGAHNDPEQTAGTIRDYLIRQLRVLCAIPAKRLCRTRYQRYRSMGTVLWPRG